MPERSSSSRSNNTITGYGVVSRKASHALRPFSDLLCVLSIPNSSTRALLQISAETASSEAWRCLVRSVLEFYQLSISFVLRGFFKMSYILRHGAAAVLFSLRMKNDNSAYFIDEIIVTRHSGSTLLS
jgi:hypothetical protein